MNTWAVIDNHRRAVLAIRNNTHDADRAKGAAVVYLPAETIAVLDNLTDGLPEDTIVWPSADKAHWPWPDQPVMLVPDEAYESRFVIYNVNDEPLEEPRVDNIPVIGTLIIPPALSRHRGMKFIDEDGKIGRIDINDPGMAEVYARTSRVIHAHPRALDDDGLNCDSTTTGNVIWDEELGATENGFSQQTLRLHCLTQAIAMHKLVIEPVRMKRTQQRRFQAEGVTELLTLRPLRLGDKRQSNQAPVLRHRDHYTDGGMEKQAYRTHAHAAHTIARLDPSMTSYECRFCGAVHIGHPVMSKAC